MHFKQKYVEKHYNEIILDFLNYLLETCEFFLNSEDLGLKQ